MTIAGWISDSNPYNEFICLFYPQNKNLSFRNYKKVKICRFIPPPTIICDISNVFKIYNQYRIKVPLLRPILPMAKAGEYTHCGPFHCGPCPLWSLTIVVINYLAIVVTYKYSPIYPGYHCGLWLLWSYHCGPLPLWSLTIVVSQLLLQHRTA